MVRRARRCSRAGAAPPASSRDAVDHQHAIIHQHLALADGAAGDQEFVVVENGLDAVTPPFPQKRVMNPFVHDWAFSGPWPMVGCLSNPLVGEPRTRHDLPPRQHVLCQVSGSSLGETLPAFHRGTPPWFPMKKNTATTPPPSRSRSSTPPPTSQGQRGVPRFPLRRRSRPSGDRFFSAPLLGLYRRRLLSPWFASGALVFFRLPSLPCRLPPSPKPGSSFTRALQRTDLPSKRVAERVGPFGTGAGGIDGHEVSSSGTAVLQAFCLQLLVGGRVPHHAGRTRTTSSTPTPTPIRTE